MTPVVLKNDAPQQDGRGSRRDEERARQVPQGQVPCCRVTNSKGKPDFPMTKLGRAARGVNRQILVRGDVAVKLNYPHGS